MANDLTAADIKRIRGKYGLSQQAFARVLGIGEASIARYEKGQVPTRANANLIRAAEKSEFMLDCLQRDGERLTERQREETEKIIYAEITFDEKGEVMDINEIYEITLQQEILNEQAAEMLGNLHRLKRQALQNGDTALAAIYEDISNQIALAKHRILDAENEREVAEVRGRILGLADFAKILGAKAA